MREKMSTGTGKTTVVLPWQVELLAEEPAQNPNVIRQPRLHRRRHSQGLHERLSRTAADHFQAPLSV